MSGLVQLKDGDVSEPITLMTVWAAIKPIIPNIIGGLLALWRVKDEVKWEDKSSGGKVFTVLITPVVFLVALLVGYYFGGAILEFIGSQAVGSEKTLTNAFIMILTTASSLRFLRMFMVRIEEVFDIVFDGIVNSIKKFFGMKGDSPHDKNNGGEE